MVNAISTLTAPLAGADQILSQAIRDMADPLTRRETDYDSLLDIIGDAHFVLIGEASHGTHEFYRERATITRRLIEEKGFNVVAAEADWPDAYRINCYVRGAGSDTDGHEALAGFTRFPSWMWANTDVLDFVEWLHDYNGGGNASRQAGFYGIDLYSMHASARAVLGYLDKIDPEAAARARQRYACLDHSNEDAQAYGYAVSFGLSKSCEDAVVRQLIDLQEHAGEFIHRDGPMAEDAYFYAEQNARLVQNAEEYYRTMFSGRVSSWNLRDRHMADSLDALVAHVERRVGTARAVVWAHNSHLGDARATEMGAQGEWNVGQLVRERHAGQTCSIGFTTYRGEVTAATNWDEPPQRKRVRPGLAGSCEALFHEVNMPNFLLNLRSDNDVVAALHQQRLQRAIGVIYRPETERLSHYFHVDLPRQFDVVLHFDETHAVQPLERHEHWERGEAPETYPSGV
jgi:erythromycin esterase-like protein